jgi:hypothetical protein
MGSMRGRRHSWACPSVDKAERVLAKLSVSANHTRKPNVQESVRAATSCRFSPSMKRRFSACDALDAVRRKKNAHRSHDDHLKTRRISKSQEKFLEWFRRRQAAEVKGIANVDVTGLLDTSGENFRSVALGQVPAEKCTW